MQCCYTEDYANLFDDKRALEDLTDYQKNGIKPSSRPLFEVIEPLMLKDLSLLDIGGGVGSIVFEMFKRGIRFATHNDISTAYVRQFQHEVHRRNLENSVKSILGEFTSIASSVDRADIVTLDKVICCYADYQKLIDQSSKKSKKWFVINLPRNTWWVYLLMWFDYYWQRLTTGKAFLTYLHPVAKIENQLIKAGFRKIGQRKKREWLAILFERVDQSG